jgi:hypothetical protein
MGILVLQLGSETATFQEVTHGDIRTSPDSCELKETFERAGGDSFNSLQPTNASCCQERVAHSTLGFPPVGRTCSADSGDVSAICFRFGLDW